MEGKEGDKGDGREDCENKSEEAKNLSLLLLGSENDEDQNVYGFNQCSGAVDGCDQYVVRGHKG